MMPDSFLFRISQKILNKYKDNLSNLVIVLPSRRASLFFSTELSKIISKPIWLPEFYSIDDFIFSINSLKSINSLELFFEFYSVYFKSVKNPHSLDKCYKWANMLLNDFDEIDRSLVSKKELFSYLSDVKRIESWHLDLENNQQDIQDYLDFFKSLSVIYDGLKHSLLEKNLAYPGLAQRLIAEGLSSLQNWLNHKQKQKVIFIGLDALTVSQEKIIDFLLEKNLCDIFWDADTYFINNMEQEAGSFLRRYQKKWPQALDISSDFLDTPKNIKIIGATKSVNQAKLLANILQEKSFTEKELKKVAVILPNEDLLLSVLESIPTKINNINVTMGYKLTHHPVISLFQDVLNVFLNTRNIKVGSKIQTRHFAKKDIIKLLNNFYFKSIIDHHVNVSEDLINCFNRTAFNYLTYDYIQDNIQLIKGSFLETVLLISTSNCRDIISLFQDLLNRLLSLEAGISQEEVFLEECLYEIQNHLNIFTSFLTQINFKIDIKLFSKFFHHIIKSIKINFSGEPLNGLQVMGLLESRTIDFNHVFVLSANENNLPPANNNNSFMPFDVKLKFGIRTNLDLESTYSNNFFNLIKRSQNTYIIYNRDYSSYNSSERSRFINQLLYEIKPLSKPSIQINEYTSMAPFVLDNELGQSVFTQKDNFLVKKLMDLFIRGLSPSTMNLYNLCRKQFYYEKIIGVFPIQEAPSSIDSATIGLIIHRSLELLYQPYLNINLSNSDMSNIYNSIIKSIKTAFIESKIDNISRGKNLLAFEAIKRIIKNYIKSELLLVKNGNTIMIKYLEKSFSKSLSLSTKFFKSSVPINFKGHIDRVDIFNGVYRVIDYKTGFVSSSDLKINNLSDISSKPKLFQLLMYSWLLNNQKGYQNISIVAGVINLRAFNFEIQKCIINKNTLINNVIFNQFEQHLLQISGDMLDPKETFECINKNEQCFFCD